MKLEVSDLYLSHEQVVLDPISQIESALTSST